MTHKIISINGLRIAVAFLQGTFHPKHSTAICFEVSLFDISVELSPLPVKSMFWLSSEPIRLQEITYPDLVVARTDNYSPKWRWLVVVIYRGREANFYWAACCKAYQVFLGKSPEPKKEKKADA